MKIGDTVKHINTGDCIYTILKIHGNIATLQNPKELQTKLNKNAKNSVIIDVSICDMDNLIKI